MKKHSTTIRQALTRGHSQNWSSVNAVFGVDCKRCGHHWNPRGLSVRPNRCPKCSSTMWDFTEAEVHEVKTGFPSTLACETV